MDFELKDIEALSARELRKVIREALGFTARDALNFTQSEVLQIWRATGFSGLAKETPSWWVSQLQLPTQPTKQNTVLIVLLLLKTTVALIKERVTAALSRRIPPIRRIRSTQTETVRRLAESVNIPPTQTEQDSICMKNVAAASELVRSLPAHIKSKVVECSINGLTGTITLKVYVGE